MSDFCVFESLSPCQTLITGRRDGVLFSTFLFTTLRLRVYEYQCLAGVFVKWSDGIEGFIFCFYFWL